VIPQIILSGHNISTNCFAYEFTVFDHFVIILSAAEKTPVNSRGVLPGADAANPGLQIVFYFMPGSFCAGRLFGAGAAFCRAGRARGEGAR